MPHVKQQVPNISSTNLCYGLNEYQISSNFLPLILYIAIADFVKKNAPEALCFIQAEIESLSAYVEVKSNMKFVEISFHGCRYINISKLYKSQHTSSTFSTIYNHIKLALVHTNVQRLTERKSFMKSPTLVHEIEQSK